MILTVKRGLVYLFGSSVSQADRDAFAQQSLDLRDASSVLTVLPNFNYTRAIIFYASRENLAEVLRSFDACAINAAIHGNLLIPCADDPAVRKLVSAHILSDKYAEISNRTRVFPDFVSSTFLFREGPIGFPEIAKLCSLWDAGPSANSSLTIDGKSYVARQGEHDDSLEDSLLLQRGFPDCRCIVTQPLTLGKSGATVLKVHPVFEAAVYGNSTRPLYAKLDSLQRIKQEVENYATYVESAIPFFMRPNLIRSRCVLAGQGYRKGLIVGNFVEHSEPIIHAINRGSAGLSLHALFDHAFRTWRLGSRIEKNVSLLASLAKMGLVRKRPIRQEYVPLARSFGLERTPERITDMLEAFPAAAHRVGAIHGDLHADNLHVRGIEPILLDFYSVDFGPLVYDLATLEVSVVFSGYTVANSDLDNWKKLVDLLYDRPAFVHPPEPQIHGSTLENLWIAVRQLRCIAPTLEISGDDYPLAIAFCLLRNAGHKRESALRTAYGLVAAERLISQLIGSRDAKVR